MANSINGAGASAGFVVSNGDAAPRHVKRGRHALLGSSALIGIAMTATSAGAQSFPVGGGTIVVNGGGTTTNNTGANGGFENTDGTSLTITDVTITNTTGSPTIDAIRFTRTSFSGNGDGFSFNGTNTLVAASGGSGMNFSSTGGNNSGIGFNGTLNVTGLNGIVASSNGAIFHSGAATFNLIAQTNGSGSGLLWTSANSCICDTSLTGAFNASGFQYGADLTANNSFIFFTTGSGGAITGVQQGIRANAQNVELSIGSSISASSTGIGATATNGFAQVTATGAIVAPSGIVASGTNGAIVITSGGGTINSTSSGTGTGIIASSSAGTGNVTVTVGAAIGGTTGFSTGVNASTTGSATGTVNITTTAAINSTGTSTTQYGILASRTGAASNGTISVGADVTGGQGVSVNGGFDISVAAGATVTAVANGSASPSSTAYGVFTSSSLGSLMNAGTIRATGTNGIGVYNTNGITITNMTGATISGALFGIYNQNAGTLTNAGAITSTAGTAFRSFGGTLTNSGTISGVVGVSVDGNQLTLNNNAGGTIAGSAGAGVLLNASPGTSSVFTNAGIITGGSGNQGINAVSGILTFTNQSGGVISGGLGALNLANTNSSTITLASGSTTTGDILSSNSGVRTLTVAGLLTGNYSGSTGTGTVNFTLASTGSMQGATFGSANDTFTFQGGTIGGVVNAGNGSSDTFDSVLGAGNSATVSLSNLTGFENYNHLSGTLTLSGSRASGPGWNVTSGASVTLSGSLNVTSGTGTAFSINGNTSGTVFEVLASGSITGFAGLFFNGGPSATLNNAGSISVTNVAVQTNGSTAITNTGTLASSGNVAIFTGVTVASLINSGTVSGGMNSFGVSSQFRAMTITNQAGGFITGGNGAILGGSSGQGGLLTISNASGAGITGATAISTTGNAGIALTNSGQVIGSTNAINAGGTGAVTITNNVGGVIATGTLASAGATYVAGGTNTALVLASGTVTNNGTIEGAAGGIRSENTGGSLTLTNTGVITSRGTSTANNRDGVFASGSATVLNSGTISAADFAAIVVSTGTGTITNAAAGTLTGGNQGAVGVAVNLDSGGSFTNYGMASSAGGHGFYSDSNIASTINLHAGSTTGSILTGSGNDTLALFNGRGTASAATVDGASGITLQNAGTLAGATVGSIDLGGGTNTLALRGIGDGTAANGAIGILSAASINGLSVLNKLDSGTWNVTNGSLNYTGGTNVQGGRLVFVNRTAPSGTATISSGATLELMNNGGQLFQDGATFNGAGTLTKSGSGNLANRSLISLSAGGLIDVQGGLLSGSSDGLGRFTGNLASLNIASGAIFDGVEGVVIIDGLTGSGLLRGGFFGSGSTTIGIANGSATFNGTITDSTNVPSPLILNKVGTGTQTLTGANTYTGATTISGGTLALSGTSTLGSSAITNNATFDIAGHTGGLSVLNLVGSGTTTLGANTLTITNGSGTYSGTIGGTGGLTKQGSGTYILTGANTYTGATTISGGTLALSGTGTLASGAVVTNNATFDIAGRSANLSIANLVGSGVTALGGNTLTLTNASGVYSGSLTGSGGLIKQGAGTYTLSGANTFTGALLIEGGTLVYGANDVLADTVSVTVNAGTTFDLAGFSDTIGTLELFGTLANGGLLTAGTYNAYAGSTIGQAISSGTLNVLGNTLLTAATAATPVNISAGTLTTGSADLLADAGAVSIASGAQLTLGGSETIGSLTDLSGAGGIVELAGFNLTVGGANTDTSFSGNIQSNAMGSGLTKTGTGTLTLSGTNTGLDTISINGGTLSVASAANLGTTGMIGLFGGTLATTGSFATDRTFLTTSMAPGGGINVATGTTLTVNNAITGDGALTKSGLGTLDLLADNSGLTGDLFVNGGALRAGNINAFGTGTIHLVDPTLIYGVTGTFANNIVLEVQTPASADPSTLRAESGVFATISGSITQRTGMGVDPNQPLVIDGLGRIILTNTSNLWAGTTTINVGATLEGTTGTISGSDTVANGLLLFAQPTSGTFAQNVSGSGNVQITGLGAGQTFTLGGALTNANGLQVLDGSALAVTGSVTTTGNFSAVTLNGNNTAGITSQLNNSGSISGVFAINARANLDLTNSGSISSSAANFNNSGIFASGNATVVNSGQITSGTNAISAQGTANLTNSGLIRGGINASTIRLVGANSSLNNLASGVITTTGTGGGIFFDGANAAVINAGSITGGNAVQLVAGGTVTNTGTLTSTVGSSVVFNTTGSVDNQAPGVIQGATNGVTFAAGTATIANAGAITGSNGSGLRLLGGGTVTNAATGTITGIGNAAIFVQGGTLTLVNLGTLTGTTGVAVITSGGFNNVIDLRSGSTTNGSVTTDTGADSLALDLGATVNGAIDGGAGIDSFIVTGAGSSTLGGNISNFESLAMNGSGTLTLGGTNTGFASVAVNSGTLNATGGAAIDDTVAVTVASGATFGVVASETVGTLVLAGTLAGTGTLTATSYTLDGAAVNGNLGVGALLQRSGTSVLNGTAASADVMVQGGTLTLGASNRLADAATVAVSTGATLNLGAFNDTVGVLALGGTLAGTGTLTANQYQLTGATVNANLGAGTLFQLGGTSVLNGTAAASTVMVNGGTLTLGGNERLADTAAVQVAGGATFNLAGRTETIGSFGGMGTVALGAGRLVAGGSNADFGFGGNITGRGDLDKVGTGTFTLASNLAQTGRLNLNAGTTFFTGSTAGSVRVQGGTLTGSAAIAGNLTVASGTFSPGTAAQPIAMFTAGSFNASGGMLTFDLGGPATGFAADMINVSGATVLSGGTVFTRPLEATANYRVSQNYVLLRSGTLTGTFANGATFAPTGTNPDLQWRLRYDLLPNAVVLELRKQIDFTTDLGPSASGNELAVGAALNGGAFMASDDWAAILNTISSQDPATRRATFNSISGEAISDISSATMIATSGFTDLLRQRLALGGGTSGNANLLSGLVGGKQALVALAASTPLDGAALPTDGADAASDGDEKRGGVWLQGYGANGRIDGLTGQAGVDTFSAGVAGGIDARFGNITVGGAFAVSQVETRVRARTSTNEGTLYQGGGYVAYDNGRLYGSVIGSYFSGDINSRRSVFVGGALFGVANGTAATRGYTGGAALGYRVPLSQSLLFTPQVSFTATGVTRGAFTETGAGGLSLQAARERREIYAATAEGRLSRPFNALGGTVEPYIGGGAIYSFGDLDTVSTNRFTGAPLGTGTFTIEGARLSPVTALVNGGINVRPSQNVRLGLQGEARLSQRQREERISLNLRIGF